VAQIYLRALGSLSVTSYDLQGYGGGILSRLQLLKSFAAFYGTKRFITEFTRALLWFLF
jgi:hypothetical protein